MQNKELARFKYAARQGRKYTQRFQALPVKSNVWNTFLNIRPELP